MASQSTTVAPLRIGRWIADPQLDELRADGQVIKLEPRQMALLMALARTPGRVVTVDELYDTVWTGLVVTPSSIYKAVAQLRRSLGDDSDSPSYIANVPRKGYRLLAPVAACTDEPTAAVVTPVPEPPAPTPPPPPDTAPMDWRRRAWIAAAAGSGVLAAAAGWRAWPWWWPPPDPVLQLAVLPFADASDPAQPVLAAGLTDDVQAALERMAGVAVSARTSALRLSAQGQHATAIAERLGASHLVRGSVQRRADRVTLQLEVTAQGQGRALWTGSYERADAQLPGLGAQAAGALLAALKLQPRAGAVAGGTARNYAALEAYFAGTQHLRQATPEAVRTARDDFKRATEFDGLFANAWAALALGWMAAKDFEGLPLRAALGYAQPFAEKALSLDPESATAHAVQGYVYLSALRLADADQHLQQALQINPNSAAAQFWRAMATSFDGRPLDALPLFARAGRLDPVNFLIPLLMAQAAGDAGHYPLAQEQLRKAQELAPRHPNVPRSQGILAYAMGDTATAVQQYQQAAALNGRRYDIQRELGWLCLDLGRHDLARAAFGQALDNAPTLPYLVGESGIAALAAGDRAGAQAAMARLQAIAPPDLPPGAQASWAWLHLMLDDAATALRLADPVAGLIAADPVTLDGPWETFLARSFHIDLATIYLANDLPAKAQPLLASAAAALDRLQRQQVAWHSIPLLQARIAALRGDVDGALGLLEQAAARGSRRGWWLSMDPALRRLRADARWAGLADRLRPQAAAAAGLPR